MAGHVTVAALNPAVRISGVQQMSPRANLPWISIPIMELCISANCYCCFIAIVCCVAHSARFFVSFVTFFSVFLFSLFSFFIFEQLDQMRGRIVGCEDEQVARLKPTGHSSEHRQYRRHSTDADTGYPDYM